ncbi:hypothetical protein Pelo_8645 [Pelomyxa schiedti]|nr:hypothetical protein Pelo_8645 [Pelomyxa schiedti]
MATPESGVDNYISSILDSSTQRNPPNNVGPVLEERVDERGCRSEAICDSLLGSWMFVYSPSELQFIQDTKNSIQTQLCELRAVKTSASKSLFAQESLRLFKLLSSEDQRRLNVEELDSAARSKILSDVVNMHSTIWLDYILGTLIPEERKKEFLEHYQEHKYERELAWRASQTKGLKPRVVSEMVWSIFMSLRCSLRIFLNRELSDAELHGLSCQVVSCIDSLIHMWLETVKNSARGRLNAGRLQILWKQQQEEKEKHTRELAQAGNLAHFEGIHVVVQAHERCTMTKEEIGQLGDKLKFRLIEDYHPFTPKAHQGT